MVPSTGDSWLIRDPQRRLSLTLQRGCQSVRLPLQLLSPPTTGAPRLLSARCRSLPAAGAFLELWAAFQWQRGCCGVASQVLQGSVDSAYLTSLSVPSSGAWASCGFSFSLVSNLFPLLTAHY